MYNLNNISEVFEISFVPNNFVTIPTGFDTSLYFRAGAGLDGFYYAPMFANSTNSTLTYLMQIDMELKQVVKIIPLDPSDTTSAGVSLNNELNDILKIDPDHNIAIYTPYIGGGTIIDLNDPTNPRVLQKYSKSEPLLDFTYNNKGYQVILNKTANYQNGYWYFKDEITAAVVVTRLNVSENREMSFTPVGVFAHNYVDQYRHLAFMPEKVIAVEKEGAWSFPSCNDRW